MYKIILWMNYFFIICNFLQTVTIWQLIAHYLWVKVASWRRENATRPMHIHVWCAPREFVGLGQLLAYLHTISNCFPVAFLPDVLLAYADLSSFSPSPLCFSSFFFFSRSNLRRILLFFSVVKWRLISTGKDKRDFTWIRVSMSAI